jgi:hypothetical protein
VFGSLLAVVGGMSGRSLKIRNVGWKFKTSAEVLNRQQTIWIFS